MGININVPKSKLKNEKQAVCKLKKLALLMLGIAVSKYKVKLVKEQEILMRIADIIIESYIAESALLKTEKLIEKNGFENCKNEINMTQNGLQESLNIAKISSEEIIMATSVGLKRKLLISIAKKLTYPLQINIKKIRRSISEKLQKDGKYSFSI